MVADTQIVKTGRYNKGIIYSRRPAAGVRRITAKVKTVICEQAPNHGSYFAYARLIARVTVNLQNNNIRAFHIIGEVIHSAGGESQDLRAQNGIGDILHDAGGLTVAQCNVCADRIEDDTL